MFGLEYLISLMSVAVQVGMAIVWAIPVNFIWKRIGSIYFNFLPEVWLNIPYWHIVGLAVLIHFVGQNIQELTPKIVKVENNNKSEKEKQNGNQKS